MSAPKGDNHGGLSLRSNTIHPVGTALPLPSPAAQTQEQQDERHEAREGADVVPESPFRDVGGHRLGVLGPGRVQGRDFTVQGYVEDARNAEGAQEVDEGGGKCQPARGGVAAQERMKRGGGAKNQCAEKAEREDGVSHGQIDRLHGGQSGKRLHRPKAGHHHEREGEEEPSHHPNPDGADQAQPGVKEHRHYTFPQAAIRARTVISRPARIHFLRIARG